MIAYFHGYQFITMANSMKIYTNDKDLIFFVCQFNWVHVKLSVDVLFSAGSYKLPGQR